MELQAAPTVPELGQQEQSLEQIRRIIQSVHGDIVGHGGTYVSLQRVLRHKRSWASRSQMLQGIDQFISGCETCHKFRKRHDKATNSRFFVEGSPFAEISVDILNLPKADCYGNAYVVMIVDSFKRFVFAVPVPDKKQPLKCWARHHAINRNIWCPTHNSLRWRWCVRFRKHLFLSKI